MLKAYCKNCEYWGGRISPPDLCQRDVCDYPDNLVDTHVGPNQGHKEQAARKNVTNACSDFKQR